MSDKHGHSTLAPPRIITYDVHGQRNMRFSTSMPNPFALSESGLDQRVREPNSSESRNTVASFVDNLVRSAQYVGLQSPLNGLVQLFDHRGRSILPQVQWVTPPETPETYSSDWVAQQLGGGAATIAQFAAAAFLLRGLGSTASRGSVALLSAERVAGSMAMGAFYGGFLTPVDPEKDFWRQRFTNAAMGCASFGAMEGIGGLMSAIGRSSFPVLGTVLRYEAPRSLFSGLLTGSATADIHAQFQHGRKATESERIESAIGFAVVNAGISTGRYVGERWWAERSSRMQPVRPSTDNQAPLFELSPNPDVNAFAMSDRAKMMSLWGTPTERARIFQLYDRAQRGVVRIEATDGVVVSGSGWFLNQAGDVVTNYHVVRGSSQFRVQFNGQRSSGFQYHLDRVLPELDIAVLKPDPGVTNRMPQIEPLPHASSSQLQPNDRVIGFGFPGTHDLVASPGVYAQRDVVADRFQGQTFYRRELASEMTIRPGNSGGPLLNDRGEIVGILNLKGRSRERQNLGVAVPIEDLHSSLRARTFLGRITSFLRAS